MQRSAFCRSRRGLSNAYFLAKFGFDTAENELCKVLQTPRRGTRDRPSSDAKASTDRAPRPAVWASTALSSGRVVVRGADVTGGERGAAGRAGASRGRQPLPTSPREAAGEGSGGHRRRREAREALKSGPGTSRHPSGGARWAQELIQDFKVIHYT